MYLQLNRVFESGLWIVEESVEMRKKRHAIVGINIQQEKTMAQTRDACNPQIPFIHTFRIYTMMTLSASVSSYKSNAVTIRQIIKHFEQW